MIPLRPNVEPREIRHVLSEKVTMVYDYVGNPESFSWNREGCREKLSTGMTDIGVGKFWQKQKVDAKSPTPVST